VTTWDGAIDRPTDDHRRDETVRRAGDLARRRTTGYEAISFAFQLRRRYKDESTTPWSGAAVKT